MRVGVGETVLDDDIPSLNPAEVSEALSKSFQDGRIDGSRRG